MLRIREPVARRHVVGASCGHSADCGDLALVLWKSQDFRWSFGQKNRTVIVRPSHSHRTISARPLHAGSQHERRTISAQNARNCTGVAPFPYDLRLLMALRGLSLYKKSHDARTQCVLKRRSHLRCLNNRMENRRHICRTAPGANVN